MSVSPDWRSHPERPSITPAFAMGVGIWGACAIAYPALRTVPIESCALLGCVSAVAASILLPIALHCKTLRVVALMADALCLGLLIASIGSYTIKEDIADIPQFEGLTTLKLAEDTRASDNHEQALADFDSMGRTVRVLAVFKGPERLYRGEQVYARVTVSRSAIEEQYLWDKGACVRLYATTTDEGEDNLKNEPLSMLRKQAIEHIGSDNVESCFIAAVVCGYRHELDALDEYGSFQTCGLAHLVAVSGAHLAIVAGLVATCLRLARVRQSVTIATTIFILGAYLVFSGMPASAIRAAFMASIGLTSFFGGRRPSSLNALGVGMCIMVAQSPSTAVSASFALSCLSTAGIVLFDPLIEYKMDVLLSGKFESVSSSLALTASASLLSQLYATSLFGLLPVVSPLANLVSAPLFAPMCATGLLAAVADVLHIPLAGVLQIVSNSIASLLIRVVDALANVPYASVPFAIDSVVALGVSFAMAALVWIIWMQISASKIALAIVFAIALFGFATQIESSRDEIVMFDVGQGDAVLIRSRGQSLLIDTGNQDAKLIAALGRNHVLHLGSVLVTHADNDHYGSLDALKRSVHVERGIVCADMLECDDEACQDVVSQLDELAGEIVAVKVGDTFRVGAFSCQVVWPHDYADDGGNADSLCLLVAYDADDDGAADAHALMMGDAEKEELAQMIEEGSIGHIDILKVGHHGSKNAMTSQEIDVLTPIIALIGVGEHNRYGHPNDETLKLLDECDASVYRTDNNGDISCSFSASGVSVSALK